MEQGLGLLATRDTPNHIADKLGQGAISTPSSQVLGSLMIAIVISATLSAPIPMAFGTRLPFRLDAFIQHLM